MSKARKSKNKGGFKTLSRREDNPLVQELIEFGKQHQGVQGMSKCLVPLAPLSQRVVLSMGFNVSITTGAGEVDSQVFRGNGLFDPDVTGVGSQPLGFDQWSAFYGKNRVLASSLEFHASTPDATTNDQSALDVGVFPAVGGSLPSTLAAARTMPYAQFKVINGIIPTAASHFKIAMESSVIMGIPRAALLVDDNLAGTPSTDPAELWYWIILTQPSDQAAATTIRLVGTIHYLVDFFDKSLLSLSVADNVVIRKTKSLKSLSVLLKKK